MVTYMTKTPKEMAKEYVAGEDYWEEEAAGAYSGFLAGYEAGKEAMLNVQSRMDGAIDRMFQRATSNSPEKSNGWISVKDRLPKENGPILMWSGRLEDVPTCAAAGYELWNWSTEHTPHDYRLFEITHWMPLPEPPEEK